MRPCPRPHPQPHRRLTATVSSRCRLVDATALPVYDLGLDHPFARDRQVPLFDLLGRHGWIGDAERLRSEPATAAQLAAAHDPEYVAAVAALSAPQPARALVLEAPLFGLGTADNPLAPGQHDAARAIAGATIACVREVMSGRAAAAFNPAGGLHHAMRARASGFCVYNDLVLGILEAKALGAQRVLYVDFDVHHGDGVERAFWSDPSVMTISFHETPEARWPFTGRITDLGEGAARGTAINVPLSSGTEDDSWLECVRAVLLPLARRFRPDLIVSQHGCDPHREDPLAELCLSTQAMHEAARITRLLALELCAGRWVATGGGGYQPVRVIPRVWSIVWAIMSERGVPGAVDPGWNAAWQHRSSRPLAPRFEDEPVAVGPLARAAATANAATVARLCALLGQD